MNKTFFVVKLLAIVLVYFLFIQEGIEKGQKEFYRKNWESVQGKVIEFIIQEEPASAGKKLISTQLHYTFEYKGSSSNVTEYISSDEVYPEHVDIEELKEIKGKQYGPGTYIQIRVNPKNSSEYTIETPSNTYIYQIVFGFMIVAVLLFFAVRDVQKELAIRKNSKFEF